MTIRQAEGWHLWKKLMVMPRQACRCIVSSVLVILGLLLTGTELLGAPAFGSWDEAVEYWYRQGQEGLRRMFDPQCTENPTCWRDAVRMYREGMRCMGPPDGPCGYVKEPPKPPASAPCPKGSILTVSNTCIPKAKRPFMCLDGYVPDSQGNCVSEAMALASCLDEGLVDLKYCGKICDVTDVKGLITEGGATWAGALAGGKAGLTLCAPLAPLGLTGPGALVVLGCGAFGIWMGGQIGYLGAQEIDTCDKKCWINFQMALEKRRRSVAQLKSQ
jgi:hypothetical protein